MALLDYVNLVLPKIAPKYRMAFMHKDRFWSKVVNAQKVKLSGGTKVKVRRVTGRHSDAVEINGANLQIPVAKVDTFSTAEFDWGRWGFPIVLPHPDRDRMPDNAEKKAWVDATIRAAVTDKMIGVSTRILTGKLRGGNPVYGIIGTLNGSAAAAARAKAGLENGAIYFQTPTDQAAGAATYLGLTRTLDTTNDTNHWHNQYIAHSGIGTGVTDVIAEIRELADSYAETEGEDRITMGILSIRNLRKLNGELKLTSGGVSPITYTYEDAVKGRVMPWITMSDGITYIGNRYMQNAAGADDMNGPTEPILLLNPMAVAYYINAGLDMKVGKALDHLDTNGLDADVAFAINETQFVVENIQAVGATSKA